MSSPDPCLTILPPSQVIGLSFTGLAGFISCISIIFVLLLVARNYIRNLRHPPPGGEWKLIRTHVDAYLLSLLASDFLQGLGAIFDVWWAAQKKVYCSATCTTQGIVQQIGETGVAMATLAIAIHTFLVIFFRWSPGHRASWIWKIGISFIWLYVVLFALIAYGKHHSPSNSNSQIDDFFTPTPYWCWISGHFNPERIAGEYFWLWLAAFTSIALYSLLYFRVRGNITVDPQNWWRVRFKWRRWTAGDEGNGDAYYGGSGGNARGGEAGKTAAREALSMIWYPVTYTILVLPLSIVRWSTFRPPGHAEPNVPFALTAIVVTIFSLSGIANVILMLMTRKNLLLFGQRGVVNPAKIGPAATGRLAQHAGGKGGGRGGAAAGANQARRIPDDEEEDNVGLEKRGRFNFRPIRPNKHNEREREREERESSTTENSVERHHGDTSFAAGRFTTKAYETERSFDVGSDGLPFTPSPRSPQSPVSPRSRSFPAFATSGGGEGPTDTYGYGAGIEQSLSQGEVDLGTETGIPEGMSRDLGSAGEYDLERDTREWRSFGSVRSPLSATGGPPGGLLRVDQDTPGEHHQNSNRSNFLELSKDSKSAPGSSQEYIASSYPPPPLVEERRGSAASRTSRKSSSAAADYSIPMKFNPTPAPPALSPFADPPTIHHHHSPYYQSRNASSKSLPKSSTPPTSASSLSPTYPRLTTRKSSGDIADRDKDSNKSPWAPITALFSSSSSSSSSKRHQEAHDSSPFTEERRPSVARSDTVLIQHHRSSQPDQNYEPEHKEAGIHPLRFSRDFGPSLRSSLSLVGSEKDRALRRSVEEIQPIPISIPPRDSLGRLHTRTTDAGSNSGSWSRAVGGGGAGRKALHEEDGYNYRPDTSGSGMSYTSYTFGPTVASGTSGSVRGGGRSSVEMHERMRYDSLNRVSLYPPEDEIGRAV